MAVDDPDDLVELLSYLDGDYEGTGWTEEDVEALITPPEPPGGGDPDDAPEPPAEPLSVLGDLWILGEHRLLIGDATSPDHRAVPQRQPGRHRPPSARPPRFRHRPPRPGN